MPANCLCPGATSTEHSVDIPADAKPKGNYCSCTAEEVPKRLRLYPAAISWTWIVKLYAWQTTLSATIVPPDFIYQITSACYLTVGGSYLSVSHHKSTAPDMRELI